MDCFGNATSVDLVILSFLYQKDCENLEFQKELHSLGRELNVTRYINSNGPRRDTLEDGELETDGHFASSVKGSFGDIQPQVELDLPLNHEEAEALREVTAGLIEIADQLEGSVVAQATQNLARKLLNAQLLNAPIQRWKDHLTLEVQWVVRQSQGFGLEHLQQERVIVALTLTLLKGVCEQAPRLLRSLFSTALLYLNPVMAR